LIIKVDDTKRLGVANSQKGLLLFPKSVNANSQGRFPKPFLKS